MGWTAPSVDIGGEAVGDGISHGPEGEILTQTEALRKASEKMQSF